MFKSKKQDAVQKMDAAIERRIADGTDVADVETAAVETVALPPPDEVVMAPVVDGRADTEPVEAHPIAAQAAALVDDIATRCSGGGDVIHLEDLRALRDRIVSLR